MLVCQSVCLLAPRHPNQTALHNLFFFHLLCFTLCQRCQLCRRTSQKQRPGLNIVSRPDPSSVSVCHNSTFRSAHQNAWRNLTCHFPFCSTCAHWAALALVSLAEKVFEECFQWSNSAAITVQSQRKVPLWEA